MPIKLTPVTLALMSAVAFVIAFISASVFLLSAAFALIGAGALGLMFYVAARRAMLRRVARRRLEDRPHSV